MLKVKAWNKILFTSFKLTSRRGPYLGGGGKKWPPPPPPQKKKKKKQEPWKNLFFCFFFLAFIFVLFYLFIYLFFIFIFFVIGLCFNWFLQVYGAVYSRMY